MDKATQYRTDSNEQEILSEECIVSDASHLFQMFQSQYFAVARWQNGGNQRRAMPTSRTFDPS